MIHIGDCRESMRAMPAESVQCCVTSPPYFGLRDYGVDGQIGLEATPDEFIVAMVEVFREVRRVLRDDGTCWVNLGDTYATNGGPGWQGKNGERADRRFTGTRNTVAMREQSRTAFDAFKPKDLIGIPWMVAFALRQDGWYLRQDIIWAKPNPMPESVRDRCTKAHEYLFLLSKSPRYYYDADAIREPILESTAKRIAQNVDRQAGSNRVPGKTNGPMKAVTRGMRNTSAESYGLTRGTTNQSCAHPDGANKRSVWTVATQPFKEAHFATFPEALIEPCILAGSRAGDTVLDPFMGAGTTAVVCERLGRQWIGCELKPEYAAMANARIRATQPGLQFATEETA